MIPLKRLILYVVILAGMTSCGSEPTEYDCAVLQKTGMNQYCATDSSCCYCKCYEEQGLKGLIFEGKCVCGGSYGDPSICDEEIEVCLLGSEDCIQYSYNRAKDYCDYERGI